jgi:hypothetical protein
MLEDPSSKQARPASNQHFRWDGEIESAEFTDAQRTQIVNHVEKSLRFPRSQYAVGQRLKLAQIVFSGERFCAHGMRVCYRNFVCDARAIPQKYFGTPSEGFFGRVA